MNPRPNPTRRRFLATSAAAAVTTLAAPARLAAVPAGLHVATNTYPWGTFARRANRTYPPHADALLADIAALERSDNVVARLATLSLRSTAATSAAAPPRP